MLKHKRIESFLPVFNGFYNTYFEADEESIIERPFKYDDYEFDYAAYNNSVGIEVTSTIEDKLRELFGAGIKVSYQNISSPKEYNFTNDSINVAYKLDTEAIKNINAYLVANKTAFAEYVKERYTSRSGFISFWDNDAEVWFKEYLSNKKSLEHCFGAVLEFIFANEAYTSYDLYNDISDKVYLDGWLKDGVGGIDTKIEEVANAEYKTKDVETITNELLTFFEQDLDEMPSYLDYGYIFDKVNELFKTIDNKTLSLFA